MSAYVALFGVDLAEVKQCWVIAGVFHGNIDTSIQQHNYFLLRTLCTLKRGIYCIYELLTMITIKENYFGVPKHYNKNIEKIDHLLNMGQ